METLSIVSNVRHQLLVFLLAPLLAIQSFAQTQLINAHTMKRKAISEGLVIDLIISFLLVAILFPIAQAQIVSATTTLWNTSVITMFAVLLPILVIIAIVYHFIKG